MRILTRSCVWAVWPWVDPFPSLTQLVQLTEQLFTYGDWGMPAGGLCTVGAGCLGFLLPGKGK